jgi:hypothetical protein
MTDISFTWSEGQKIESAIAATLDNYYAEERPGVKYTYVFYVSDLLVCPKGGIDIHIRNAKNINGFSDSLYHISHEILNDKRYLGIRLYPVKNHTVYIDDAADLIKYANEKYFNNGGVDKFPAPVIKSSAPEPKPEADQPKPEADQPKPRKVVEIKFYELIGQPVIENGGTVTFKTSVRNDFDLSTIVEFKEPAQAIVTLPASVSDKNNLSVVGQLRINQIRHVMNFKSPDANAWVTVFSATFLN